MWITIIVPRQIRKDVDDNDGPRRRVRKGVAACKGQIHNYDDGIICGTSWKGGEVLMQGS